MLVIGKNTMGRLYLPGFMNGVWKEQKRLMKILIGS
jgi:hypothetical protein